MEDLIGNMDVEKKIDLPALARKICLFDMDEQTKVSFDPVN